MRIRTKEKKRKELFQEAARQLGIPEKRVEAVYCGYWKYIKENIENDTPRTTFNVPFLGKIDKKKNACKEDNQDSCKEGGENT